MTDILFSPIRLDELDTLVQNAVNKALNNFTASGNQHGSAKPLRPKPETPIFGLNECSEFTGFSKSAIYARTSTGAIPFFKRDGKILFRRDEILDWLQEGKKPDLTSELDEKLLKRKTGK